MNNKIIFGLQFKTLALFQQALEIATQYPDKVNEDYSYCVLRERGMEVAYCRDNKLPFVAFDTDMNVLDTNVLLDKIDKASWRFVLRLIAPLEDKYFGIQPLQNDLAEVSVLLWAKLGDSIAEYTKRNLAIVHSRAFSSHLERLKEDGKPVFIKTVDKGVRSDLTLHHIFQKPEDYLAFNQTNTSFLRTWGDIDSAPVTFLFKQDDWYCPYRDSIERGRQDLVAINDDFIVSDVMNIQTDESNRKVEYRCYVVNKKVVSISRYEDYDDFTIPQSVIDFAQSFAQCAGAANLPDIYVMDIAQTDKDLQLIELNPYELSGRYFGNKPELFYQAFYPEHDNSEWFSWCLEPMKVLPIKEESASMETNLTRKVLVD